MAVSKTELRLAMLEAEVASLKQQVQSLNRTSADWLDETYGAFADFPEYDKVIAFGRKYRASLRPKAKRKAVPGKPAKKAIGWKG